MLSQPLQSARLRQEHATISIDLPHGLALARSGAIASGVVHLSVAIGRFFEALLYALFGIAVRTTLGVVAGAAVLLGLFALAQWLLRRGKRGR